VPATAQQLVARLEALAQPVRMGEVFSLAAALVDMPIDEIDILLTSPVHLRRVGALTIMGKQFNRKSTTPERRQELYELYLRRTDRINTWDLVDLSGHHVIGGYLVDKPTDRPLRPGPFRRLVGAAAGDLRDPPLCTKRCGLVAQVQVRRLTGWRRVLVNASGREVEGPCAG
jgi:hypothetical protein